MGRDPYQFTDKQIKKAEELAFLGCQNNTIATILGCDNETVKKYLSQQLTKKRAERKAWLRQVQKDRAEKDSSGAVAIFLGKNELNQTDKQELSGPEGGPIPVSIVDFRNIPTQADQADQDEKQDDPE